MVHGTVVRFQYDSQLTHKSVTIKVNYCTKNFMIATKLRAMTILPIHKIVRMKGKYIISVISTTLAVL